MSKVILYTDVHWCTYSSIVRKRGSKYSVRLEHLIDSMNFVQDVANRYNAKATICLGDFFDKADLTSEELTALREINWSNIQHYFIVGNHESEVSDLSYSSTKALESLDKNNFKILNKVEHFNIDNLSVLILPYIIEENRKPLEEYTKGLDTSNLVILSHNDIKGIQYGKFQSKEGFEIPDILSHCKYMFNGHLHNSSYLDEECRILNLGNLCGMNFTEDSSIYPHLVGILDTDTLELTFEENPYALNFYNVFLSQALYTSFQNGVVTCHCKKDEIEQAKEVLNNSNIIEYRLVVESPLGESIKENKIEELKVDKYLDKFVECFSEKIEASELLKQELGEIIKCD